MEEDFEFFQNPITDKIIGSPYQFDFLDFSEEDKKKIPSEGRKFVINIENKGQLKCNILKSDTASVYIKEIDFFWEASTGKYCSIEQLIEEIAESLREAPISHPKLNEILEHIENAGESPFTMIIDDPLARSQVERHKGMEKNVEIVYYQRTWDQIFEYGLCDVPKVRFQGELAIEHLEKAIQQSSKILILTGAGTSVESGIPAWRLTGDSDIWKQYDENAINYNSFLKDEEARKKYWAKSLYFWQKRKQAQPNDTHRFVKLLEDRGKLLTVITQNIDNLFQQSGVQKVLNIHGSADDVRCLSCKKHYDYKQILEELEKNPEQVPSCTECEGILKADTILFGESLNKEILEQSRRCIAECDLMIVVGSSLIVKPVSEFPSQRLSNVPLALINLSETQYDGFCNFLIKEKCGVVFGQLLKRFQN